MRGRISCILAAVLFTTTTLESRGSVLGAISLGRMAAEQPSNLKERLLAVPPGTMIEVRLQTKQKIRGRLGEISDEGFSLTTLQEQKVVKEEIAFADLKSFKKVEGGKAGHRVLWMLAGVGALVLILSVIILARGDD
jgi:hypothetical protein